MDCASVTRTAVLLATLAVAVAPLGAQQAPGVAVGSERRGEPQRQLQNKLKLLAGMLENSPAVRRIEAARHSSEANALLAQARRSHAQAERQLQAGELDAAGRSLDAGLRAFGIAARTVADVEREQQIKRSQYRTLRKRATSFRTAFARVVTEKGAAAAALFDQTRFDGQLARAEALAQEQRYREANAHLGQALATVEQALARARDQETLVQTLNFATPADEYAYELERNRSHQMLVRLMLAERELQSASRGLIAEFLARNETARTRALALVEQGDTAAAIEALETGTRELVRALRLTGLSF